VWTTLTHMVMSRIVAKKASTRTIILTAGVLPLLVLSPVAGVAAARPLASLTSSSLPRSLEGLGQPTEGFGIEGSQSQCYGYKSVAEGAHLQMAGTTYNRGFQTTTSAYCGTIWTWAWHIGGHYRTFSALVGLDATEAGQTSLSFIGSTGNQIPFRADGHLVQRTIPISGLPTAVRINLTGVLNFGVETTSGAATIDFANDNLAP